MKLLCIVGFMFVLCMLSIVKADKGNVGKGNDGGNPLCKTKVGDITENPNDKRSICSLSKTEFDFYFNRHKCEAELFSCFNQQYQNDQDCDGNNDSDYTEKSVITLQTCNGGNGFAYNHASYRVVNSQSIQICQYIQLRDVKRESLYFDLDHYCDIGGEGNSQQFTSVGYYPVALTLCISYDQSNKEVYVSVSDFFGNSTCTSNGCTYESEYTNNRILRAESNVDWDTNIITTKVYSTDSDGNNVELLEEDSVNFFTSCDTTDSTALAIKKNNNNDGGNPLCKTKVGDITENPNDKRSICSLSKTEFDFYFNRHKCEPEVSSCSNGHYSVDGECDGKYEDVSNRLQVRTLQTCNGGDGFAYNEAEYFHIINQNVEQKMVCHYIQLRNIRYEERFFQNSLYCDTSGWFDAKWEETNNLPLGLILCLSLNQSNNTKTLIGVSDDFRNYTCNDNGCIWERELTNNRTLRAESNVDWDTNIITTKVYSTDSDGNNVELLEEDSVNFFTSCDATNANTSLLGTTSATTLSMISIIVAIAVIAIFVIGTGKWMYSKHQDTINNNMNDEISSIEMQT